MITEMTLAVDVKHEHGGPLAKGDMIVFSCDEWGRDPRLRELECEFLGTMPDDHFY